MVLKNCCRTTIIEKEKLNPFRLRQFNCFQNHKSS